MCLAENIKGHGVDGFVTTHGLRGTMASLLIEAGFSDAAVSLRTSHRSLNSLRIYKDPKCETTPNIKIIYTRKKRKILTIQENEKICHWGVP